MRTVERTGGAMRRWLAASVVALLTAAIVGLGVFVVGRLADAPSVAMAATVAWFAAALAAAFLLVRRRRGLLVPVGAGYVVAAVATGVLVGLPTLVDRTVNDAEVLVADFPSTDPGPSATGGGRTGTATAPTPAARPAATELGRAQLAGIDHTATGTARLIRLADGSLLVRLENIDIQPGPDYYVHLVSGAGQRDPGSGTRLARLKGNRGSQNYPVPRNREVATPATVLIWCRTFDTPIANATIR